MYDIMHLPAVIEIGYCGENLFRTIEIDMRPWLQVLPNGVASIIHIRPGETENDAYITGATMADGILRWSPTNADLGTVEGYGQMEIFLEETADSDTKRGKSVIVHSFVRGAIASGSAEPPEPQESWLEQMTELKTETVEAAEAAEDSAEDAEAWAVGQRNGTNVESGDPAYHNNSKYYAQEASGSATDAATAKNAAVGAKVAAETAQGKAETAALHYPYVDSTTGNWFVWNVSSGAYVDTEVHAKGDTGAVPAIAVGTVTTLQPDQSAYVQRRSGSPDTAPIFDFGIPKGDTGQAENLYGNTIDMSSTDTTKVSAAINKKANIETVAYKETGNTASQNIAKGSYVIWKGTLYTASAAITQGDTLSIMNLSPVTPGGVANKLKAYVDGLNSTLAGLISDKLNKICAAAEYSSSSTYDLGDLCMNGELLYRCTTAIPVAESWTAGHWTATTINNELKLRDTAIGGKAGKVSGATSGNFAALDGSGDLVDSGYKPGDYLGVSEVGIVEDGDTATHAITEGQYVIWKGALYKASTSIAIGTTLSTSTNLTSKTVSGALEDIDGELTALNGKISTLQSIDSNKTASNFPVGIFPIVWPTGVTIGGVTAQGNRRGIACNTGTLMHAFMSDVNTGDGYSIGLNVNSWVVKSF